MSKSKTTTQQNSTATSTIDPRYNDAAWQNYGQAQDAMKGWSPTAVPTPLGFNDQQLAGQRTVTDLANSDPNGGYLGQAGQLFTQAGGYKPLSIAPQSIVAPQISQTPGATGQGYTATNGAASQVDRNAIRNISGGTVDPAQMSSPELQRYMSMIDPSYTNNVVNQFLNDNERSRAMAQQPNATAAAQAGAFGGTRQAVLEAETNRGFANTAAATTSGLRLNEYNTALANYQADLARKQQASGQTSAQALAASQANQGMDANTASTNAGLSQQMSMANAAAQNAASQYGAGAQNTASLANAQSDAARAQAQAQLGLSASQGNAAASLAAQQANQQAGYQAANLGMSAGQNLAGLGQQIRGNTLDNANLLSQVGQQNYDLSAAQQQADYQNRLNQANAPLMQNQFLQGSLGAVPFGQTMTNNGTSTVTQSPSILSQIMGGVGMGAQIFAPQLAKWGK